MRGISLLFLGAALGSCTTAPPLSTRTAENEKQYQMLLAGKVAGAPVSCLPEFNVNDMLVVDDNTVAFRVGTSRVYVNHFRNGCANLTGPYTLITRRVGALGPCSGDIATVEDIRNHFTVGSCVFGDFTPYVKAGT